MAYLHEGTGYSGPGCGGNCACDSCRRRTNLSEYYFEDDSERREGPRRAGSNGIGEAASSAPVTRNVKIVVKSYIAPIGPRAGSPYCGGFMNPSADLRLRALGLATDAAMSENPLTDLKDKRYRLYSSRSFAVSCGNGRILSVVPSLIDMDTGTECIPRTTACLQPPPLIVSDVRAGLTGPNAFEFAWTARGRPHLAAEPAFQAVCPRSSVYIWHRISGRISCAGDEVRVDTRLTGSAFPSHRVFVNGVLRAPTIPQGPFSNLWVPASVSNPTLVR
jgi:hypothetical protein